MSELPHHVYSSADVRAIDAVAIGEYQLPGIELMERAGAAALAAAQQRFGKGAAIGIVCGAGNNAGDGYVIGRLALEQGHDVQLAALSDPAALKGDAADGFARYRAAGGAVQAELPSRAELVFDALLGTGITRDVDGAYAAVIESLNDCGRPVVAVDVPSGLDADTGTVRGHAVVAALTVTFVGLKSGLFLNDAPRHCGEIVFDDLGIPAAAYDRFRPAYRLVGRRQLADWLPRRDRLSHKGHFGHVLVVGGGTGMAGAATLCASAALRSGAGLVSVAAAPGSVAAIAARVPEAMTHAVDDARGLEPLLARATVIALGPGLGLDARAAALADAALSASLPIVVDADALTLLSRQPRRSEGWILTPHPGEAARLLDCSTATVQSDRRAALDALNERYAGTAVLKGAGTLIGNGKKVPWLNAAGNPGMASGGMGDVLTGVIAALRAQGLSPLRAAALGSWVHARAGDRAAQIGERGLVASDVVAALRACVN